MANSARLPTVPHSDEAEQALLGGIMLDATAWARIASLVSASDFYRADHRSIFIGIAFLVDHGQAIDAVTVADHLERRGVLDDAGGLGYIARLANETPTAANVETYAKLVRDRSSLRRLKAIADQIARSVESPGERSAAELIADSQHALQELQSHARTDSGLVEVRQLVRDLIDDLDRRADGPTGLRVGLADLDDATNGLEAGDLLVFGARPSMGKTAVMVSIAITASQTVGTAIFSAEMPTQQLMRRALASQADVPQGLLRRTDRLNDAQWASIGSAAGALATRKLWIDDTGSPTLAHIRAEVLAIKAKAPLGLVLIDYCQLVRAPGANRYEQLRDVAYGLKALAKEIAAPIIVLAQLNREVESRDDKRPHVADLRDSGAIEEAADIVGLLYSEGFYDSTFPMAYVMECAIAKNRNGERVECVWRFDAALSRVTMLDPGAAAQYRRLLRKQTARSADDL